MPNRPAGPAAPANFTVRNHYVPQWYQRRFLAAGSSQQWYLDLKPDVIPLQNGKTTTRKAMRRLGPISCFEQDHLYTLVFGPYATDVMEKRFFGTLDSTGEKSVPFFANFSVREGVHPAFRGLLDYLSAQLFRTPKGLQMLRALSGTDQHQALLLVLQRFWQLFQTIWTEGVWEVVECKDSPTKFILSDSPVVSYNPQVYPGSAEARTFGMARFERIGTRMLFPIDSDHCLVITNLQYVRNPNAGPLRIRENPRYYGDTLFDLRKIQRGRQIDEAEVVAINHVLKSHAVRYVAAAEKSWLFPERSIGKTPWPKVGGRYFLMPDPRKVSFTTGVYVGYDDGDAWGVNEYGHRDADNARARALRSKESETFYASRRAWDERDRRAGRPRPADLKDYW